ncbi:MULTISPECIES: hypothetical protein [unclassified Exiguobacterium]|nr:MULTISPECIES: hypothetical protein [unclassified Exiguobacterium]
MALFREYRKGNPGMQMVWGAIRLESLLKRKAIGRDPAALL